MNVYNDVIEIYVNGSHATNIDDDFIYEYLCKHSPESVSTDDDEIEYVLADEHRINYLEIIKRKDDYIRRLQQRYDMIFNQLGDRDKNLVVDKEVVDKLKTKVKEYFGTQNEFAKKLGISKSMASKWLNGKEPIPFKRAEQIKDIINGVHYFAEVSDEEEEYDVDEDAGYDAYKEELAGMNDYIKEKEL